MNACLACGREGLTPLLELGPTPALTGALWPDRAAAREARRGRLDLVACTGCGHVANAAFDPELVDYGEEYDASLHHSATFREFASSLARRLVEDRGVRGRHVVEIGSGKGDFLEELCRLGGNTATGYDPTVQHDRRIPGVRLVADYFRPGQDLEDYDLLVCRHVLEHLESPADLLRAVRASAPEQSLLYLEVPSAEFNFGPEGMWDCIYPHVSYFSTTSLEALVRRCGFTVDRAGEAFGGQFLWVEVRPGVPESAPAGGAVLEHLERLETFREHWAENVSRWRRTIDDRAARGDRLALWGAGSKGVTFLNAVDEAARLSVVDLNPNKWGRYLPGTGHLIEEPRSLVERPVATVLITNPVYRDEIAAELRDMGVQADVVSV